MVKISVIMPVYNDADRLDKSINSVLSQTLDDIELVCVNDGSTDNSLEILESYCEKYEFIKVYSQTNQGSGKARNYGIECAEGEYIGFLDADDFFIDDDALEKLYSAASENNADMVSGNIKLVNENDELSPFEKFDYFEEFGSILPEEYGIPWSFYKNIFKKSFLKDNNIIFPDLLRGQDPVFLAEVLSKVNRVYTAPADVYAYFYINGAKQCNTYRKRRDTVMHYKMVFDYLNDSKFDDIRHEFRYAMLGFIDMMGIDSASDMLTAYREVFADDPDNLRAAEEYFYFKYKDNQDLIDSFDFESDDYLDFDNGSMKLNKIPDKPRISVLIPVYNAEKFLDESIPSVLNQTFDDIELICVNDGSPDNSLAILEDFASKDSRVKIINKENGGCGSARNRAITEAKGDYIYFFDPDDYILPNALEMLYRNIITNGSDLVICNFKKVSDTGDSNYNIDCSFYIETMFDDVNFNRFVFNCMDVKKDVLNSHFAPWNKLYKKEFLDSYDDFLFDLGIAFDDVPFHIKSMLRANKISYVPEHLYEYKYNPNSVNNTASNGKDIFRIIDIVENILKKENCTSDFKNEFELFTISHIIAYMVSTNSEEYLTRAKEVFSNLNLEDNELVSGIKLNRYNLVLKANSVKEYEFEDYKLQIDDLKSTVDDLRSFNKKSSDMIKDFAERNIKLSEKNKKLSKKNKKLTKKIKKLTKKNKKLKKDLKKAQKLNKEILNSTSWKLTGVFRKPKTVLKKFRD